MQFTKHIYYANTYSFGPLLRMYAVKKKHFSSKYVIHAGFYFDGILEVNGPVVTIFYHIITNMNFIYITTKISYQKSSLEKLTFSLL